MTESSEAPLTRLVLVAASLEGGGAERQMAQMANYWVAKGLHVTLATWSGPRLDDFYHLDNRVRRKHLQVAPSEQAGGVFLSSLRRIRKLRELLRLDRPDVVLSFIAENNVLTILAGTGLKARIVVSERSHPAHDSTVSPVSRLLRKILYAWSDSVVVQTDEAARWIEESCRKKALVIPNALRSLPEVVVGVKEPLILAVGRLAREKGFDLLLEAFALAAREFPDWSVAIVGEGGEYEDLLRLRERLNLTTRVEFVGQVRDVETWMARAGLIVQPSRFEGFPNVVLEAMGMGAAVVSTDRATGPAALIEDGVNGRLVPPEDPVSLAKAMTELMSQPEVCARLGREASKVRERFHMDLIMAQWEAALLSQRGRRAAVFNLKREA